MSNPQLHTIDGTRGPELWATPTPPEHARLVSYSELGSMDCWLKHHYSYTIGLRPVERFAALQLGTAWDAFYNVWHGGEQPLEELPRYAPALPDIDADLLPEAVENALLEVIDGIDLIDMAPALAAADHALRAEATRVLGELTDKGVPVPADFDHDLAVQRTTIYGMAIHYVARWGSADPGDTIGVQVRFAVPLPSASGGKSNRYYLHGVIDRLMLVGNDAWIIDAKLKMTDIDTAYREGFERDPQLALYGWALREAGWNAVGGFIDAASAKLPTWPMLKKHPEKVLDAAGEPLLEPVPCDLCGGANTAGCERCYGTGVETFKSGARAGEVKTRAVTRPGFYSGWAASTSQPVALAAIDHHGIPPLQYADDLTDLGHRWSGAIEDRFHWKMDALPFTDRQLQQVSLAARGVAGYLDSLPPVPNPSRMRCRFCSFRDLCPSVEPVDYAEGFTTRDERRALAERRLASSLAGAAAGDDLPI
jgi:hypothetical protein